MNYQQSSVCYARALMAALNAPSESLQNKYSAKASQYGSGLTANTKAAIQRSVAVQAKLLDFLANGGIN